MITALILIPVGGALLLWLIPFSRFWTGALAFLISLVEVGLWIDMLVRFDFSGGIQFEAQQSWFSDLNVSYHVGFYGFSVWLVGLTAVVLAAATGYAVWAGRERPLVVGSVGELVKGFGLAGRDTSRLQTGLVRTYVLLIAASIAVLTVVFVAVR